MRDFKFDPQVLFSFSQNDPYKITHSHSSLWDELDENRKKLNFPAIHIDVGSLIHFFTMTARPSTIFEMGSGYGHSSFWYFINPQFLPNKVILTEKRTDLEEVYHSINWPGDWKNRTEYHQGDAFDILEQQKQVDFALIDGVKADYLSFLLKLSPIMPTGGLVFIDNSFWRGSFLDRSIVEKKSSARKIAQLHQFIRETDEWTSVFVPFQDGLTILRKNH